MNQSTYDFCLLHLNNSTSFGIVGLQTDDTLFVANDEFAEDEQRQIEKAGFLTKPREKLTLQQLIKFNGAMIELRERHEKREAEEPREKLTCF